MIRFLIECNFGECPSTLWDFYMQEMRSRNRERVPGHAFPNAILTLAPPGPVPGCLSWPCNPRQSQAVAVVGGKPLHGLELIAGHEVLQGLVSISFH